MMPDAERADEGKLTPASEDELQIAFSGPAIAANKVFVTLATGGVRIAFVEQRSPNAGPLFRTAVMMPFQDAIALRNLLSRLLKDVEQEIQKAAAATTKVK